jgi:hypothetical protein
LNSNDASDRAREVLRFSVDAYSGDNKQKIGTQEFHLEQSAKTPDAAGVSGFTDLTRQAIGKFNLAGEFTPSPKSSAPLLQGKLKLPLKPLAYSDRDGGWSGKQTSSAEGKGRFKNTEHWRI